MTTLYLIDVDAATLIIDRIRGLFTLAETQIDAMGDADRVEACPLNAAIWCLKSHVEQLDDLLNAGIAKREEEPT